LRQKYAEIQALGASLVAVSPQLEHYNRELVKERKLPFEVLSDSGNQVAEKYRVAFTLPDSMRWVYSEIFKLDLPKFNGDDSWTLPMPSRFIVDQHADIRAADVNLDHTVRPEPDTAIEALRILKN
jgi:peroxiredoxin